MSDDAISDHRLHYFAITATALLACAGAAKAQTQPPQEQAIQPLSASDLTKMAEPIRRFVPKDSFDSPPRLSLQGRSFVIEQSVREAGNGGCVELPFWRYRPASGELELAALGGTRGFDATVPIACEQQDKGSYQVSNAFGAKTTITKRTERSTEIALSQDYHPLILTTVSMAPEEARSVTKNLKVRIEGQLSTWGQQGSLICNIEHTDVDMSTIWDTTSDRCLYSGDISKIAFINGSSGRVIAERTFSETPRNYP